MLRVLKWAQLPRGLCTLATETCRTLPVAALLLVSAASVTSPELTSSCCRAVCDRLPPIRPAVLYRWSPWYLRLLPSSRP